MDGALAEPADLAADSPASAIRVWGRLGYPRRALRLHAAATAITVDHRGVVPDTVETLLTLPGIGEYTARAVAAFAFGARTPVVDTNVRRVLSRVVRGVDEPREPATAADRALMTTLLPVEPAARRQVLGRRDGTGRAGLLCPVADLRELPAGRSLPLAAGRLPARRGATGGADLARHRPAGSGKIMASLRAGHGPISAAELGQLEVEAAQLERCLASLVADGLVVRIGDAHLGLPD